MPTSAKGPDQRVIVSFDDQGQRAGNGGLVCLEVRHLRKGEGRSSATTRLRGAVSRTDYVPGCRVRGLADRGGRVRM